MKTFVVADDRAAGDARHTAGQGARIDESFRQLSGPDGGTSTNAEGATFVLVKTLTQLC